MERTGEQFKGAFAHYLFAMAQPASREHRSQEFVSSSRRLEFHFSNSHFLPCRAHWQTLNPPHVGRLLLPSSPNRHMDARQQAHQGRTMQVRHSRSCIGPVGTKRQPEARYWQRKEL